MEVGVVYGASRHPRRPPTSISALLLDNLSRKGGREGHLRGKLGVKHLFTPPVLPRAAGLLLVLKV